MGTSTVIYTRISDDKTGEAAGVRRQEDDCRLLAAAKHWDVKRTYSDNSISALDPRKVRPGFERLVADMESGAVSKVIVWHLDRLAVRLADLTRVIDAGRERNVEISAVHGVSIDLGDPTGVAVAQILSSIAEMERRHKGIRQARANRQRAQDGHVLWTRRPYGFDRDGHDVQIVESEAAEIRKMTDKLLAGVPLAAVARDLNARGVHTSLGGRWNGKTLKQVVTNPRVVGRVVYRGEDMGQRGPAILDAETYDRLCALLRDPRRRMVQSTGAKWLLSGIALCGRDGCELTPMLFTTNGSDRTPVYRCRTCYGVRRQVLVDDVVLAVLSARLTRPDAARLLSPDVDVSALQTHADELRRRRDGLASLLADGLLGQEAVRTEASKLAKQIDSVEREIEVATGDGPLAEVIGAEDVRATLEALPLPERREVIRTLCDVVILPAGKGIRFSPDQVDIRWKVRA